VLSHGLLGTIGKLVPLVAIALKLTQALGITAEK
jgi:hypothetical protein